MAINNYTDSQIEQIIKDHIVQKFMYNQPHVNLDNDLPLIAEGIIDSMSLFKLAGFLEEKFGFTLNPDEFVTDNFATVNAVKSLVVKKM
ncbi:MULTISPECIES: acyl carrier protein [unclassified Anabaena]|uniref:acyl carrier protein n=1 Tax=unclassified Anabaena TaxID=2619674 RepID=UPI000829EEA0|nr:MULTISPECIES: acyl carrier protein [unclassified Anabaena]